MVDLNKNYFELFDLPVSCQIDQSYLSKQYRTLQRATHPDRFVDSDTSLQRVAVQYSAHINEAFNTLKCPLSRLMYLLQLSGREVDIEHSTIMDSTFMMEQMELRDKISDLQVTAKPEHDLEQLTEQVNTDIHRYLQQFERLWLPGDEQDLDEAETVVRKLHFIMKLDHELRQMKTQLLND